ncbi:protein ripply3 [Spea bombifrons]|uniref:protein ripply3 n=1 Tax=Spea bombifrons TaxID=233779 RepID=UPI0023496595|nr:protein ripply3 [Spea bombifrons]
MDSLHYTLKATISHMCHCSAVSASAMHPGEPDSGRALWRPWVMTLADQEQHRQSDKTDANNRDAQSKGAHGFQHPVRLYMPKSKTNEYLQHMGKKVLASFPVQATIHFYNDDTDSEEEEEDDYEMEFYRHYQNFDQDPGKMAGSTLEEDSTLPSSHIGHYGSQ